MIFLAVRSCDCFLGVFVNGVSIHLNGPPEIMSRLNAKWQGECLMFGLIVVRIAHATASNDHCISANQCDPLKIIVLNISPMVRSMTPLLLGFLKWVNCFDPSALEAPGQQIRFRCHKLPKLVLVNDTTAHYQRV
jgi:hypothetical protein